MVLWSIEYYVFAYDSYVKNNESVTWISAPLKHSSKAVCSHPPSVGIMLTEYTVGLETGGGPMNNTYTEKYRTC